MGECAAKTKEGTTCKLETKPGEKYCHVHKRRRIRILITSVSAAGFIALGVLSFIADITGILDFVGLPASKTQVPRPTEISETTIESNAGPFLYDEDTRWLDQLKHNPLIPNVGMAGIKIGDSETYVIQILGDPTRDIFQVRAKDDEMVNGPNIGEIVWYALVYEKEGLIFAVYTDRDSRDVRGFRIFDDNFNEHKFLPSFNGVTIGSDKNEMMKKYGDPILTNESENCPLEDRTTTYYYDGISFWVCEDNQLIYGLDVP